MVGCFGRKNSSVAAAAASTNVKYDAYAAALPAPRLFNLTGRVVVKLLHSSNAGLVIQTIGRVNRGDISSAYVFEPVIAGCGQTGQIRTCTDRYTGRRCAVKSFVKGVAAKERVNLFRNEAQVLLKLDHPHVARLLEVWEDLSAVHFVMEYCSGGDLLTWLSNRRLIQPPDYAENERYARALITQMTRTLLYLHSQNVVHRDLKLDHWLIDGAWTNSGMISEVPFLKLIDFGLARRFNPESRSMRASCGTLPYVAPEVLLGGYNTQCDMWSLGVIAFMLVTGAPPFYGTEENMIQAIISGPPVSSLMPKKVSQAVSSDCIDFIEKLLLRNPSDRLTAREAFDHPWILPRPKPRPRSISTRLIDPHRLFVDLPRALALTPEFKFFRKIVVSLMAYTLTSDRMMEARDLFLLLDETGEGMINSACLEKFISKIDPTLDKARVHQISAAMDIFSRGGVHFNDFLCALLGSFLPLDEALMRQTFWKFDRRRTGQVSVENMREVLGTLYGDRTLETFLREADRDQDKNIDYDEFVHIINPLEINS